MIVTPMAILIALTFGFGVMALLTLAFGMIERGVAGARRRSVLHGSIFGVGAALAMLEPVHFGDGVILDGRSVIVGLAAAFGGGPAAFVAALVAGGVRLYLGGVGAIAGAVGIAIAAALGLLWARHLRPEGRAGLMHLAGLGTLLALHTSSVAFLPAALIVVVAIKAIPVLAAGCILGTIVMGHLLDRERGHLSVEGTLRRDAHTDALTDLPNRRAFDWTLAAVAAAASERRACALMLVDADHFKRVNDRHGHAGGDEALKFIVARLRHAAPDGSHVCRIGGEEFAVILEGTSYAEALRAAEALRSEVEARPFVHDAIPVPLTVSIGVTMGNGPETAEASELLRAADLALYAAKTRGRNRIVFHGALRGAHGRLASVLLDGEETEVLA